MIRKIGILGVLLAGLSSPLAGQEITGILDNSGLERRLAVVEQPVKEDTRVFFFNSVVDVDHDGATSELEYLGKKSEFSLNETMGIGCAMPKNETGKQFWFEVYDSRGNLAYKSNMAFYNSSDIMKLNNIMLFLQERGNYFAVAKLNDLVIGRKQFEVLGRNEMRNNNSSVLIEAYSNGFDLHLVNFVKDMSNTGRINKDNFYGEKEVFSPNESLTFAGFADNQDGRKIAFEVYASDGRKVFHSSSYVTGNHVGLKQEGVMPVLYERDGEGDYSVFVTSNARIIAKREFRIEKDRRIMLVPY